MLKTGIYVDAENVRLCGGYGMRYDVLAGLANSSNSVLLRANSYLAEDRKQTAENQEYRQRLYNYHDILRNCGFKLIKKYVKHYVDENGQVTTKANADMDLAIDAILQARNLDRVILLTGDGDFVRLIIALQNKGCRVEVIGFNNVSGSLREAADFYISGFLIPGLLPFVSGEDSHKWHRGTVINYNAAKGYGFIRYYLFTPDKGLQSESVFFHHSKSPAVHDPHLYSNQHTIFEFKIEHSGRQKDRSEALDLKLFEAED